MKWPGFAAHMGELRNAYIILVWKHGSKRELERYRCTW